MIDAARASSYFSWAAGPTWVVGILVCVVDPLWLVNGALVLAIDKACLWPPSDSSSLVAFLQMRMDVPQ